MTMYSACGFMLDYPYCFWAVRYESGVSLYSNSLNIEIRDKSGWTKEQQVQRL